MYEKENLEKALEAVMSGVMTQYSASVKNLQKS
jgi:hypothetical protein